MKPYPLYTAETAKFPADKLLLSVENMLGFVPNVFATLAESEPALRAFMQLNTQMSETHFTPTEREVIQAAVSVENECSYCVAGHSAFAEMQGVDTNTINAVRDRDRINDVRLEALQTFSSVLSNSKGVINKDHLQDFLSAGYTAEQALEVILGVCVKTFSNLTNNLIQIPLDEEFVEYRWNPKQSSVDISNKHKGKHVRTG
ncbi:MAG: carboxymuconolactone decarboxylase [endosymbiont of Galathealinum brachiosum]|uniref:Carboxymuconolactone decarboxylase n=1 Tax=endosymbiont of Galathealinum brachiosum TaxID=2200906 RepID=A0A370DDB8_9GAMM|nr:MAG: carboxymuconolactone decarboxylase [endosymbiont of Galathealinum brachiosum]